MSFARTVARQAGRRGAFLAFLSILDLVYGFSLLTAGPLVARSAGLLLGWKAWGAIWVSVGVVTGTGVFVKRDRLQYAVSATLKTAWGLLYVELWLVQGVPRAWLAVVVWLAFAATIAVVAGWPEAVYIIEPPLPLPGEELPR